MSRQTLRSAVGHTWSWGFAIVVVALAAALALIAAGGQGALAQGVTIYVDADATGANDGNSWDDAFTDLQDALDEALTGTVDEIWVAAGTYKPTVEYGGTGDRHKSFQLMNEVAIYGGFDPGAGSVAWEDRDWATHVTTLSGDIGTVGDSSDNAYHVFYHPAGTDLDSSAILDGFIITGGNASSTHPHDDGGGMYNDGSSPSLANCTFSGNSASWAGGGMSNDNGSSPTLTNCTFSGNEATSEGGGMRNLSSSPALTNCTFSGNEAGKGGGMYNTLGSAPSLTNCILWGDTSPEISNYESTPVVTYSDVQSGYDGEGNINADPLFLNAAIGDLRLQLTSPATDAGDNDAPGLAGITTDLGGNPRFAGTVDMGAYETPPPVILVDLEATGDNDGTSWEDAFTGLQPALAWAVDGVEIWVAEGTYKPTSGTGRTASFQMVNGVAIYGGFDPSVGDIAWEDRDWATHETILSGDLNGDDGPHFTNNGENSYHVFYHPAGTDLDSSAILDGFIITGGNADGASPHLYGGGMVNDGSAPTLTNCTFSGNAAQYGGGMSNFNYGSPVLTNCAFADNSAEYDGGGMGNYSASSPVLTNCTFSDNSAQYGGGMSNFNFSSPALTNCTFSGNSAEYEGGGMYNCTASSPALTNCILWGDTAGGLPEEIYNDDSSPVVTYSDVQGGFPGVGNIDADPLFVDAAGDDLRLQLTSPAIDAGDNAAPNLPDYDFEGDRRVADGDHDGIATVDMGADEVYEAPPNRIFVDHEAGGGANNGASWEDALTNLQAALVWAEEGVEIWVAEGIYKPTSGTDRTASFQMVNGVAIYGGFDPSVGDIAWEDRDWATHVTTLSGDLNGDDGPDFANNDENSYHIFYHPAGTGLDNSAILDGFIITGGNADGASPYPYGGGMVNDGSSPTLTNCTFSGNAAYWGGGMLNDGSAPTLTNCTFSGNAAQYGGGMYNFASSPALTNCTFSGNSAQYEGGGMSNYSASSPVLTNCTFSGNAAYWGGGMFNYYSSPTLTNCILWGDSQNEVSNEGSSSVVITYSDVQGGYSGVGNIDADPLFVDPANGDYHLAAGSPAIDAGDNAAPNLPDYDFEGDRRVADDDHDGIATVDMGADEVYEAPPNRIFVDHEAGGGGNNGASWEDALTNLQAALVWAEEGVEIWVAEGIYKPTSGTDRTTSFQMKNGVAIYGGFDPSVGDIAWEDRAWATHVTTLNGDLNGDDGLDFANNDENSYHVFYHPAGTDLDNSAILDGFTISGGNADGAGAHDDGGGMFNDGSSPTLTNCTFSGNSAQLGGGLSNCNYGSPVLTNCTFADNSAENDGGGMFNAYESSPVLTNCTFSGNSAACGGGMSNYSESSPVLTNCTFSDNSAEYVGGGMYNYYSSPTLTNCILWGDTLPEYMDDYFSSSVVTYSDVQGGYSGWRNIDADPLFVDPANGDYHLAAGSPCIDAGDNNAPDLPLYDFEGDDRILDGDGIGTAIVDMGVDEFSGGGSSVTEVEIDITPNTPSNIIRLGSGPDVPVAILTITGEFDAADVDPLTVLFAGALPVESHLEDVDGDGDQDLLLTFNPGDLDLDENDKQATLTGETYDEVLIEGTDRVKVKE